jgi:CheY-like chemotaxis protein
MSLENLHILVVDDDDENRQLLEVFLSANGAQVTGCVDGAFAYQQMTIQAFSCIVSDIHMPNMGGLELLSKIRHILRCDTPVILISGEVRFTKTELAFNGAQGFLQKPFPLQSLKNLILNCGL